MCATTGCSRPCRQSNVDGRSQTQAEGGLRRDVLLTDLVAIQSQRLQPGEAGHVGEGAEATQSELWRGDGEGVNVRPQTSSIWIKQVSVALNVDDWEFGIRTFHEMLNVSVADTLVRDSRIDVQLYIHE